MIKRLLSLPKNHSLFLFGPRQTGKSTLIQSSFADKPTIYYDLLKTEDYHRLSISPSLFRQEIESRDQKIDTVIVDEVQRIPGLLNEVHYLIEHDKSLHFVLSGSSARKLKRSHANLLAGRAWTFQLSPLTHVEIGSNFSLSAALNLGTLPAVYLSKDIKEAEWTLKAYVETYLKEEIEQEALVRNLGGFLRFLTLAADENGNILNYSNIARETGASYQTIKEYFKILEDTLVGFMLLPYSKGFRKRLVKHPKFYFFDTGVHRALSKKISLPLQPKTSEFGRAFEHFMILEMVRLARYRDLDYQFSFYNSSNHAEVDLIVETPAGKIFALEFKATENPDSSSFTGLKSFLEICPKAQAFCVCLAPRRRNSGNISVLPWKEIFEATGMSASRFL